MHPLQETAVNISPLFGAISQLLHNDPAASFQVPPTPGCPPQGPEPGPLAAALRNSLFDRLALNPQPIPPSRPSFDLGALNPQPLPPEPPPDLGRAPLRSSLFDLVALNPQPIPPGRPSVDLGALNPQPLPPEPPPHLTRGALSTSLFDLVALNPQPLPPRQGPAVF